MGGQVVDMVTGDAAQLLLDRQILGRNALQSRLGRGNDLVVHAPQQFFLARKIRVERGPGNAGGDRNIVQGGSVVAALAEHVGRDLQDFLFHGSAFAGAFACQHVGFL